VILLSNNINLFNDNIKLKDIFIGYANGESESTEKNFLDLFYVNSNYDEIISNKNKFIISGRKGTGKTILAKYIEKNYANNGYLCTTRKINDFNLQSLIDLNETVLPKSELSVFWKWTILLEICKLILSGKPNPHTVKTVFYHNRLKRFYCNLYSDSIFTVNSYSKSSNNKLGGIVKIPTALNEINTSAEIAYNITKNFQKNKYYNLLNKLDCLLNKCLPNYNLILIYDDLDEFQRNMQDDFSYIDLLLSLIAVSNDINLKLVNTNSSSSRILILLRDDILNMLHLYSANLNRLIVDSEVNLNWPKNTCKDPWENPLMDMILSKISVSVKDFSNMSKECIYRRLFPEKINHQEASDYLMDYSFGRPRDIINYLNIIKNTYPNARYFGSQLFTSCKATYSSKFLNELENELSIHNNPKVVQESLNIIRDLKYQTFDYATIKNFYNKNISNYPSINSIDNCLNFLYKFGVIGNTKNISRNIKKPKYKITWCYGDGGSSNPNFSEKFIVHYALRKNFGI
jgi:hypothetical protein